LQRFCFNPWGECQIDKKRKHIRVPLAGVAVIGLRDYEDVQLIQTTIADISMSGIGLYLDETLELYRDISIEIQFIGADGLMKTDYIEGYIVYAIPIGKIYFIGVEFDKEIDSTRQPFLYERLQRILTLNSSGFFEEFFM